MPLILTQDRNKNRPPYTVATKPKDYFTVEGFTLKNFKALMSPLEKTNKLNTYYTGGCFCFRLELLQL